jgi:16S rRNA processing protein RimM
VSKKPLDASRRLVEMGRISAPFGIKGWVRIQPFTREADGLTAYKTWWLDDAAGWREVKVESAQAQGADVIARLEGCDDRDAAAALKGRQVAVAREAFPAAGVGEYYWADLVGLRVRNNEGLELGVVEAMLETGANDVMVVRTAEHEAGSVGGSERLIPFIAQVIRRVDVAAGVIEVDWGADY